MCGIAGVVNQNGEAVPVNLVKRLTDTLAHRGPDGDGVYTDGPVGLGHRRLAIIDLSAAGHQPMANETGDVIITFNGEIYNFHQLRVELEALGHQFHSRTDTESIIHAYEEWGEECVHRFNGMFAFAIWDRPRRRLFLARDRHGIKPLYWYWGNNVFLFASEVKAILEHPHVSCNVCLPALNEYFTFQNIFTDLTLFEGVRLLPAGSSMVLDVDQPAGPRQRRYWDYPLCPEPLALPEADCVERLYQLFVQGVTRQLERHGLRLDRRHRRQARGPADHLHGRLRFDLGLRPGAGL